LTDGAWTCKQLFQSTDGGDAARGSAAGTGGGFGGYNSDQSGGSGGNGAVKIIVTYDEVL